MCQFHFLVLPLLPNSIFIHLLPLYFPSCYLFSTSFLTVSFPQPPFLSNRSLAPHFPILFTVLQ